MLKLNRIQQPSMDNCQYRTNQSIYSRSLHKSQHSCPTCRCKSVEPQINNIQHIYRPFYNHNNQKKQEHNLYLSNHFSEKSQQQLPINPFYSNIFIKRIKNDFSPNKTNITFHYISPNKQKSHSNDSRFNTKTFKNSKFPQIHNKFIDCQTIATTYKKSMKESPYLEIFTKQNTPEKHKLLKNNKNKSKQKLSITLTKKSSENSSQKEKKQVNYNEYQLNYLKPALNIHQNGYLLQSPKNTPINQLWANQSKQTSKRQTNSVQYINYFKKLNPPTSIQIIQSNKNINIFYKNPKPTKLPQKIAIKKQIVVPKNYPSAQSLKIFENNKNLTKQSFAPFKNKLFHNDYDLQRKRMEQVMIKNKWSEQKQLALSISEDLDLHYDYYYSKEESDRSLSLNINL